MEPSESIESLARRVAALEAFLKTRGYELPVVVEVPREAEAAMPVADLATPKFEVPKPEAPPRVVPPPVVSSRLPPPLPLSSRLAEARRAASAKSIAPELPSSAASAPRMTAPASVEQAIGLKVAGWIGAIILVIGGAMGVKFAYDQGWLGGMPPELKLALMYAGALAIIGVGEWIYRTVDARAAVGIYAAGVAALFVVGYAGNAYLDVYGLQTAFGLMAGASAIGAIIALRGGLVSIAVLSHLGANVAPLILHDRVVGELPLLGYLLALQLMAVTLAHLGKGRRWWVLRTLALVSTSLWMGVRLVDFTTAHSSATLVFACAYAAIFQSELILSALRADALDEKIPQAPRKPTFSLATFSLATTASLTVALLRWSDNLPSPMQRGGVILTLGVLCLATGIATIPMGGVALRSLASSWIVQSAVLLVIAIPVILDGPAVTIGWAAVAVAYAVLGVILKRGKTVIGGAMVWCLAALQLLTAVATEGVSDELHRPFVELLDVGLPIYLGLAIVLGVAGHIVAIMATSKRLADEGKPPRTALADAMAALATLAWVTALLAGLPPLGATVGLLVVAWLLVILGLFTKRQAYAGGGTAIVTLAMAKWAAIDVLRERLGVDPADRHLLLNTPMAVGAACAVSMPIMLWRKSATVQSREVITWKWVALVLVVVAMTIGLSVEVERGVREYGSPWPKPQLIMFGWTILWIAAAHVPALVGRTFDSSRERQATAWNAARIALVLLAVKLIAFDSIAFAVDGLRAPVTPGINLQTLIALGVTGLLAWSSRRAGCPQPLASTLRAGIFAVPLAIGSIELDRIFGPNQTLIAWSVFWGLYAIASIVMGFTRRAASFRFAGLGLLGVTLLKIVLVDLASAGTGWRILSFLAVGVVLLLTSVVYGKLSPKLLGRPEELQ